MTKDSFQAKTTLSIGNKTFTYFSLSKLSHKLGAISHLPYTLKVFLENLLRHEDGEIIKADDIKALASWQPNASSAQEISFYPSRVLMQDFTGVPAIVDLAAMRQALANEGKNPDLINPLIPVDLVIDHSVTVNHFGSKEAFEENVKAEFKQNIERYRFLKWGQTAFDNLRIVPPGTGICHQVNLEYLAKVVWDNQDMIYPDTLVGTDSHTTMINGLGVLGWGVGGIEAESALLGQPLSMVVPDIIGFKLEGTLKEGVTATDLVLTVTQMLRQFNVVGKFVEFFGSGLDGLSLADRATISNMAPEYGATAAIFPIDHETLQYLKLTGRSQNHIDLVETYAKQQGLWRDDTLSYTHIISLDLNEVEASLAGPKRPQDKLSLKEVSQSAKEILFSENGNTHRYPVSESSFHLGQGDIVIAAITSCTNTSNPAVMISAGLVARKAVEKGLMVKPWVKTSLAPGSQVVTDYLHNTGLQNDLDALGFQLVGYGCTTCIGNSGPLPEQIAKTIDAHDLSVAAVLSGNRNFEGRIHSQVKLNYLASPPLVVAYALAGSILQDLNTEPLGYDPKGNPVFLKDLWPSTKEVQDLINQYVHSDIFNQRYRNVFQGTSIWQSLDVLQDNIYHWDETSSYIKEPPYFSAKKTLFQVIDHAYTLALLGDSITTDHISPAGSIKKESPAGMYLSSHGIEIADFNSYGARRGNHEVMIRGTFANIRLQNEMTPHLKGGFTQHIPSGDILSIFEVSRRYQENKTPLVVIAGKEYGTGSSRDWAAKGTMLLGVKAVIAESFERIHRSNLVGMGVIPLTFINNQNRHTLHLTGKETFSIHGINDNMTPRQILSCIITYPAGKTEQISLQSQIFTENELDFYRQGGILHATLNNVKKSF